MTRHSSDNERIAHKINLKECAQRWNQADVFSITAVFSAAETETEFVVSGLKAAYFRLFNALPRSQRNLNYEGNPYRFFFKICYKLSMRYLKEMQIFENSALCFEIVFIFKDEESINLSFEKFLNFKCDKIIFLRAPMLSSLG